jgi:hypothetical protein
MIVRDHRPDGVPRGGLLHSEQDTQSGLRRTAVLDELDSLMEIDVLGSGEVDGSRRGEPGAHERLGPPMHNKGFDRIPPRSQGFVEQCLHIWISGFGRSRCNPRKAVRSPL